MLGSAKAWKAVRRPGGLLLLFTPVGLLGRCSAGACITASALAASAGDPAHLPEAGKVHAASCCRVLLALKAWHHLESLGAAWTPASLLTCNRLPAGGAALVPQKGPDRCSRVQLHRAWWARMTDLV